MYTGKGKGKTMKILSVTWTIHDERIKSYSSNFSGGGVVIKNLCEYLGEKEESYLYLGQYDTPDLQLGNINIVSNILQGNTYDNYSRVERLIIKFKQVLSELSPDIVNVHGIGEMAIECIKVCKEYNIPCVFVEHLYIGLHKTFEKYDRDILWEKELYNIPDLDIVAVSNGMRRKILRDYKDINKNNVHVIINGTNFSWQQIHSDVREKYSLQKKKILLCVGTITQRKNQMQLVEAYKNLDYNLQENISVLFCGLDRMNSALCEKIKAYGLDEKLIYVGTIDNDEMKKYYSVADGLIMPSLAEGLSIAALEAISYGLPVIMFSDLECADDLNDPKVVSFAEQRSDDALMHAIKKWYEKQWDSDYIKEYSGNFSIKTMGDEYIKINNNLLTNRKRTKNEVKI